jgi:predicted nucleic acid-binding protein
MTTGAAEPIFLDTNVLVYANATESPWHQLALDTIRRHYDLGAPLWISRQVLREYLVTVTRPQPVLDTLPVATAIERVRTFQSQFLVAEDSPAVTVRLLELIEQVAIGGRQIHDANIVATMLVYGVPRLLTANPSDFVRFAAAIAVEPLGDPAA